MNTKIDTEIREAIAFVRAAGIKLHPGIWFEWNEEGKIISCDPIGAVLIKNNAVPDYVPQSTRSNFSETARFILNVDWSWLRRFWLGFDRGYQVLIIHEENNKEIETKDDVSHYGIGLYKEFVRHR